MDLLNKFKKKLIENDSSASKITIKNYAADIRKFVSWFETTFQRSFPPPILPLEVIEAYMKPIRDTSPRSAKRYKSSLRKFFSYLQTEGVITYNPLATKPESSSKAIDPLHLREFSNFLYTSNSSKLTIKNYILDVRQFLNWVKAVSNQADVFAKMDSFLLEEYKNRLINEAQLSPLSVNRKLSSLRKYINWAVDKGFLLDQVQVGASLVTAKSEPEADPNQIDEELTLEDLRGVAEPEPAQEKLDNKFSGFGPLRLLQKSKMALNFIFDTLVILSILKTIEGVKYNLWKATGKQVFAPLPVVLNSLNHVAQDLSTATATELAKPHLSVVDQFITMGEKATIGRFRSIPKSVYAPLKISTTNLPFWKKVKYHLVHSRPKWYKRYHSYAFSHYLHLAIVLVFATFLGLKVFQSLSATGPQKTVLASHVSPRRLLSFQGRLNDASDNPITKESPLKFAIYNSQTATGSALLWQENQIVTPDANGNFSTTLGKYAPIAQEIFNNNPSLYLGISIGSDSELTPRQELASVGLTENTQALQGLKPITGNNAGTSNVILALDSSGNLTIGGSATPVFQATGGEFKLSGQQLTLATNPGSNTNVVLTPDGTGIIDLQRPLQNTSNNNNLTSALGAVEVDDNFAILATSSAQAALIINQNSTGALISAGSSNSAKFSVDNQGSAMFAGDLSIVGNNLSTAAGTFNLANTNTLNLNIGGAATAVSIGAATGTTTINNSLKVAGSLTLPALTSGSIPFINSSNQLAQDNTNFFWDTNNKRLGLGTTSPSFRLSSVDSVSAAGGAVAAISNTNTSDSINTVTLRLNTGAATTSTKARFVTFYAGCTTENCTGTAKGNIAVTASGVDYNTGGADFAEYFSSSSSDFAQGDVVGLDENGKAVKATTDTSLLGVLSQTAGFSGNDTSGQDSNANKVLVGLLGQLPVKVSNSNGAIKIGDPLTSSATPGIAVKAIRPGQIIGRALEAYDSPTSTSNLIRISLNVSWFDPAAVLMNNGSLATAYTTPSSQSNQNSTDSIGKLATSTQEFLSTLKVGALEAQKISVNSLSVATEDITIGGKTLRDYITGIVNEILDKRLAQINVAGKTVSVVSPLADNSTTASSSADVTITPTPQPTSAPVASPSATIVNITNVYNNVSSASAAASPSATPTPSVVPPTPTAQTSISPAPTLSPAPSGSASPSATPVLSPTPAIETTNGITETNSPNIKSSPIVFNAGPFNTSFAKIATFSAELAYIPNLKSDFATFNQGLIALGPTSLSETSINGRLSIGQNLSLNENSINTLGSELNIQPLRQGNLSIMGGLVAIDTSGNLTVQGDATFAKDVTVKGTLAANIIAPVPNSDLIFKLGSSTQAGNDSSLTVHNSSSSAVFKVSQLGNIIASGSAQFANLKIVRGAEADTSLTETVASGSAGTAIISAHQTERTIVSPFVSQDSLIYITPVSATQGVSPYIARQTAENANTQSKGSFTIQISSPATSDIKLNWWIVN